DADLHVVLDDGTVRRRLAIPEGDTLADHHPRADPTRRIHDDADAVAQTQARGDLGAHRQLDPHEALGEHLVGAADDDEDQAREGATAASPPLRAAEPPKHEPALRVTGVRLSIRSPFPAESTAWGFLAHATAAFTEPRR